MKNKKWIPFVLLYLFIVNFGALIISTRITSLELLTDVYCNIIYGNCLTLILCLPAFLKH